MQYSIGVDLGGTNLRVAAFTTRHGLGKSASIPTRLSAGPDAVVDDMCSTIRQVMKSHIGDGEFVGVCIAAPGPLELPAGILHSPPNLPGWDDFDLKSAVEDRLDITVELENDANVAALAEFHLGAGAAYGASSLSMLTLGTGVGQGIILHGNVFHGSNGLAGEAGHSTIWPDGPSCACGNRGCLEMYTSATAVRRQAFEAIAAGAPGIAKLAELKPAFTANDLCNLAVAGDADALQIFDTVGEALGIAIGAVINTLNPEVVVVGGGVSHAWNVFAPRMLEELDSRSYVYRLTSSRTAFQKKTKVVKAMLAGNSGIVGAALYPLLLSGASIEENVVSLIA